MTDLKTKQILMYLHVHLILAQLCSVFLHYILILAKSNLEMQLNKVDNTT